MHDVFISYSSKDKTVADSICHAFESEGIRCWYAPRDIVAGLDWREAIITAISSARVFVLVYSKDSNQSRQVLSEVTAAFSSSCIIIPFKIDNEQMMPAFSYYLNNVHWVDATCPPLTARINALADDIKSILGNVAVNTDKPVAAKKRISTIKIPIIVILLFALLLSICFPFLTQSKTGIPENSSEPSSSEPVDPEPSSSEPVDPVVPFLEDSDAMEAACNSVVQVDCSVYGVLVCSSSGFACFDDHIIVASVPNLHSQQISMEDISIEVTTEAQLTIAAELVAYSPDLEIGILSTSGNHGIPLLEPASASDLQHGEDLILIGSYFENNIVSFGNSIETSSFVFPYSGVCQTNGTDYILFQAPTLSGEAGGPLLNHNGKVVGILRSSSDKFALALPIDQAQTLWEESSKGTSQSS